MRRGQLLGVVFAFGLMTGTAAWADEVVHFTNGTYLPVRSHEVKDGMVHVVLGSQSSMAFPVSMVERVEAGGRNLFLNSSIAAANRVVEGPAPVAGTVSTEGVAEYENQRSYPVSASRPVYKNDPKGLLDSYGAPSGNATSEPAQSSDVIRPAGNSTNPNRRKISIMGDGSLRNRGPSTLGIQGSHQVINPADGRGRFKPIQIRPRAPEESNPPENSPSPAPAEPSGSGDSPSEN